MFNKAKITAAILLSGIAFSSATNATEVSLEQFVSGMVLQAVESTKLELNHGVQKAILTANNMITFDESEIVAAKVTITDLESTKEQPEKAE